MKIVLKKTKSISSANDVFILINEGNFWLKLKIFRFEIKFEKKL